MYSLSQNCDS